MNSRHLALAALAVLALFAWLVFGPRGANDGAAERDLVVAAELGGLDTSSRVANEVGERAKIEPSGGTSVPAEETLDVGPSEHRVLLFGTVRPDPRRGVAWSEFGVCLSDRWGERRVATTAQDGAYEIADVRPGLYWLSAGSLQEGRARLQLDVPQVDKLRVDLQLALDPRVLVRLVDSMGQPVQDGSLLAVATLEPPGEWIEELRGSSSNLVGVGNFYANGPLDPLPAGYFGQVVLDREPPVYVSLAHYQRVVETRYVAAGEREVTFIVDPSCAGVQPTSLRARFVEAATRRPFAGAPVMVDGESALHTRLDAQGELYVAPWLPGWCTMRVLAAGYGNSGVRVLIQPGENDLGEIAIETGVEIAGRVIDESGRGVSISVEYESLDAVRHTSLRTGGLFGVRSDADGGFRIRSLRRGTYRLTLRAPREEFGLIARTIDASSGDVTGVEMRVAPGVPVVVRAAGDDWRDVHFEILDEHGERLFASKLRGPVPFRILLAPGDYVVACTAERATSAVRTPLRVAREPVELALP